MKRARASVSWCAVTLALAIALLAAAAPASGDVFEAISLVSTTATEQANDTGHSAISGDGRYVAFDGSVAGVTGVWRRDLLTGAVAPVATAADPMVPAPDARLPSISADGRYVSFTTTATLDSVNDVNAAPDVYVRDMSVDPSQPGAFTLASAVDGSAQGLSYDFGGQQSFGHGSLASGRSALSADGRKVAFVTTATSNLADPAAIDTPPLQVAVRDLDTMRTQLVSVEYNPATGQMTSNPVALGLDGGSSFGAVYPGGSQVPRFPDPYAGASISADGSTVAWMGQSIARQAPVLGVGDPAITVSYTEPLWRRIADGPQAPTRRITGGSDPLSSRCPPDEVQLPVAPTLEDGCQGPFEPVHEGGLSGIFTLQDVAQLPRLSADGSTVAFLATAREIAGGEEFGAAARASDDLYVADMHNGLTRVQALRRLTEIASSNISDTGRVAPVIDFGVSPDGRQVAFSTQRTTFPLGAPAYVTAPAANAGAQELFDADLGNETLTRVSQGYEGGVSEPSSATLASPSFSADGDLLAFSSTASNLVYGDGNGAGDVFVVRRKRFADSPAPQFVSAPPANPVIEPDWRLFARARSRADGSVMLEVDAPGAGRLSAGAYSTVRLRAQGASGHSAHRRAAHRATRVVMRRVCQAARSVTSSSGGLTTLRLSPAGSYQALIGKRGGLSATVNVTFSAPARRTLRLAVPVTFTRKADAAKRRRSRAAGSRPDGRRPAGGKRRR